MIIEEINLSRNQQNTYPFNLDLLNQNISLDVSSPVTILWGDNGSGKSSFLKMINTKLGLIEINYPNKVKNSLKPISSILFKPSTGKIKGFYFDSLVFINYIDYMNKEIQDARSNMSRVDNEYKEKSEYSKMMAKSPYARTIHELKSMYKGDLLKSSHGESFLDFFSSRLKDNQLYLLDEPETPLSIQNQLTLLAMIIDATKKGCQFIIATHSPVLAAFPNAIIYELENNSFNKKSFDEIENIQLLKQFLNQKEQFLKHL
jgi:predicted ATPase